MMLVPAGIKVHMAVGCTAFPEHLAREEVTLEIERTACPSCGGTLHPIGVTTSEMLDWVPASLRIIRIRRLDELLPCTWRSAEA
jgi:transposase